LFPLKYYRSFFNVFCDLHHSMSSIIFIWFSVYTPNFINIAILLFLPSRSIYLFSFNSFYIFCNHRNFFEEDALFFKIGFYAAPTQVILQQSSFTSDGRSYMPSCVLFKKRQIKRITDILSASWLVSSHEIIHVPVGIRTHSSEVQAFWNRGP
jgi:hypothetical protein